MLRVDMTTGSVVVAVAADSVWFYDFRRLATIASQNVENTEKQWRWM